MRESLLLAFNDDESIFPLTSDQNGSWYDPDMDGQGVNIEILNNGNNFLGFWYTYEPSSGQQRWFVMDGTIEDNKAQFSITSTKGGLFLDPTIPNRVEWGTGSFYVLNCNSAKLSFESESEDISGEIDLTRLTVGPGGCLQNKDNKSLGPRLY